MPPLRVPDQVLAPGRLRVLWHRVVLAAILTLSAFVNLFQLTSEGYGNTYYAAAVKNMLTSWRNFFFVTFDAGFVSVDKPPLGFWIQAASAKVFGFQGWSIILPQALAGVLSVALVYHLVRRAMGPAAGLIAALTLALTPISVAISRHNNLEGLLVLVILLATWAFVLAAETGRFRWLILGAFLIGLGFNIKMLEAFLVVPACFLLYLVAAPVTWPRRIIHLGLATVVLLVVSLSWATAVDLTPPDQRPYVGSSSNNTMMDLIVGHNGAGRLTGQDNDVGDRGPLRLLREPVVEQIGWLLPLAAVGLAVAIWQERRPRPLNRRQQALVLWGTWFITQSVFFSIAGDWDLHYLAMLSPAVAALVGIGVVALWREYRSPGWRGWILPVALAVTAGLQTQVLTNYADWNPWLRSGNHHSLCGGHRRTRGCTPRPSTEGNSLCDGRGNRRHGVTPDRAIPLGGLDDLVRRRDAHADGWSSPTRGPGGVGQLCSRRRTPARLPPVPPGHGQVPGGFRGRGVCPVCDLAHERTRDRLGRLHGERPRLEHDAAESARRCRRGAVLSVGADEPPENQGSERNLPTLHTGSEGSLATSSFFAAQRGEGNR